MQAKSWAAISASSGRRGSNRRLLPCLALPPFIIYKCRCKPSIGGEGQLTGNVGYHNNPQQLIHNNHLRRQWLATSGAESLTIFAIRHLLEGQSHQSL